MRNSAALLPKPADLDKAIREQATAGRTARLVAGFCWPWSDPLPDGTLVEDVVIGTWERPWNEKSPEAWKKPQAGPPPELPEDRQLSETAGRLGRVSAAPSGTSGSLIVQESRENPRRYP